jgi:hypothetical protein
MLGSLTASGNFGFMAAQWSELQPRVEPKIVWAAVRKVNASHRASSEGYNAANEGLVTRVGAALAV